MKNKHRSLRKAAVLLASLDGPSAEALLGQMSAGQTQALRQAVEGLGPIDPAEQSEILEEFFRIGPLVPDRRPSGIELDGSLPDDLRMPEARDESSRDAASREGVPLAARRAAAPLALLRDASVHSLAPFLEREHPQTIAVVVSHLPADRAAEVLAGLPGDLQIEVARRLVDLDETDPEVLREIERGLESWLCEQAQIDRRRVAGITALNNILGAASPRVKQHILANLNRGDRQLAGQVKSPPSRPLTFDDLQQLDSASLTVVLHHADSELLLLALAGARPEFAERAFELFPPEEAQTFRAALRNLGPTRLSDVEESQHELAELARQLELRGDIVPEVRGRLSVAV